MNAMRQHRPAIRALRFTTLVLALVAACATSDVQATDTVWVATQTQAFLPSTTATALPATTSEHVVAALNPVLPDSKPTPAQVQAVVDYLQQNGFTGIKVSSSQRLVDATGTVAGIQAAFNTTLMSFQYQGRAAFGNNAPAQVPQALGGVVVAVLGLQNVATAQAVVEVAPSPASTKARANAAGTAVEVAHELTEFPAFYDADNLPIGTGSTVAMVASGDLTAVLANLKAYTTSHGLPDVSTQVIRVGDGSYQDDPAKDLVWTTAVEAMVGMAGGLKQIVFYNPPDLSDANLILGIDTMDDEFSWPVQYASELLPFAISEDDAHRSGLMAASDNAIAFIPENIAPSGDDGAYAESEGVILDAQGNWLVAPGSYTVNYPASDRDVWAIGGTSLYTSGGIYASETGWNSGVAPVDPENLTSDQQLHAGGGGVSKFEGGQGDLFNHAPWRIVPDVAFDADPASGALVYLQGNATPVQVGGTVLAAALYVGLRIRMGYHPETPLELLYTCYADYHDHIKNDYALSGYSMQQLVHPVNEGNNGYGGYGYNAVAGYDAIGGWGSINARNLNALAIGYFHD